MWLRMVQNPTNRITELAAGDGRFVGVRLWKSFGMRRAKNAVENKGVTPVTDRAHYVKSEELPKTGTTKPKQGTWLWVNRRTLECVWRRSDRPSDGWVVVGRMK
jgi:hypothetical protein